MDGLDNVIKCSGDDSLYVWVLVVSDHCECFPCARLPVSKNCPIIPFQSIFNDAIGAIFINRLLSWLDPEYIVEYKLFNVLIFFDAENIFLILNAYWGIHISFPLVEGANSYPDFDALIFVHSNNKLVYPIYLNSIIDWYAMYRIQFKGCLINKVINYNNEQPLGEANRPKGKLKVFRPKQHQH